MKNVVRIKLELELVLDDQGLEALDKNPRAVLSDGCFRDFDRRLRSYSYSKEETCDSTIDVIKMLEDREPSLGYVRGTSVKKQSSDQISIL